MANAHPSVLLHYMLDPRVKPHQISLKRIHQLHQTPIHDARSAWLHRTRLIVGVCCFISDPARQLQLITSYAAGSHRRQLSHVTLRCVAWCWYRGSRIICLPLAWWVLWERLSMPPLIHPTTSTSNADTERYYNNNRPTELAAGDYPCIGGAGTSFKATAIVGYHEGV